MIPYAYIKGISLFFICNGVQVHWIADTNSMKPQNDNVLGFVSNCECSHKYNSG